MISAQHLMRQIRRRQLLVCAHPGTAPDAITPLLADLPAMLDLATEDCEALVSRLRVRGLVETVRLEGAPSIRITAKGLRLLQRMAGPAEN
jgi:hypothetical protein